MSVSVELKLSETEAVLFELSAAGDTALDNQS